MPVDKNMMAVTPGVMSRNPNIIHRADPIAGTVNIVWLIVDTDADGNCIRDAAYAKQ